MGRLGCREGELRCREGELRCREGELENTRKKRLAEWNWQTTPTEKVSSAQDLLVNADVKRKTSLKVNASILVGSKFRLKPNKTNPAEPPALPGDPYSPSVF